MPTLTQKRRLTVVENYDVAADAKKRVSLRNAKTKYFHVKALSNGCFLLGAARVGVASCHFRPFLEDVGQIRGQFEKRAGFGPD